MTLYKNSSFFFWIIITIFAGIVAHNPAFGIIDDHGLTENLLINKNVPLFILKEIGRFFPLNGQELNILSFIFFTSSQVFYTFNAMCLFIVAYCLSSTFHILFSPYFKNPKIISYLSTLLIIITPGFCVSWLRLFIPERMEFVFLSIFFYSYILVYTKSTQYIKTFSFLCIASSLITLFYKETAIVLLGGFSFFHIIFCLLHKKRPFNIDFFILFNTCVWIGVYYYCVLSQKDSTHLYNDTTYNYTLVILRNITNYLINDPFLTFGIVSILFIRLYNIYHKKENIIPLLDSMICASVVFIISYLILGISDLHYSLPTYIFAIPTFIIFTKKYLHSILMKISIFLISITWFFNVLPMSVYYSFFYKVTPTNFQTSLTFLDNYHNSNTSSNKIILLGVDPYRLAEVYVSFSKWIAYKNLNYTIIKDQSYVPAKGDLIIITPYIGTSFTQKDFETYQKQYKLIHISNFGVNIPLLSLRTIARWIGAKIIQDRSDFSFNTNIYGLPLYFYIFQIQ